MLARRTLALLWLSVACAHGSPAPAPMAPAPTWPAPPEAPRARWAGELPRPADPAARSWWSRAFSAVVGTDDRPAPLAPLLARPFGVAADASAVLVADPDGAAVVRFDRRSGAARRLECAGRPWTGPLAVALAPGGAVYVADGGAGAVIRVAPDGGCAEIGAGRLERPSGVAWSRGRLFVVDPPRHVVLALDGDGREVSRFGSRGEGDGQLNFPTAIAADPQGDLLVVDALNFRVVRFSPDGRFLGAFGQPGDVEGTFGRPKGVAATERQIFVTDAQYDVVLVFRRSGEFEYLIGESGMGPGQLALPAGIAIADGHLFVASAHAGRVQIYELLAERS
jgi:hypothetical protein